MAAGRRSGRAEEAASVPDLDFETADPIRPQGSSFTLQLIMELKGAQGGLTEAINGLTKSVEGHGTKLDSLSDIRADLREITTRLDTVNKTVEKNEARLERVHTWVIGAAAIIGFLVIAVPVAMRFWPAPQVAIPPISVNVPPQPPTPPTSTAPAQKPSTP
jgi:hypothetical protein